MTIYVLDTRAFPWQEERYIPAGGELKPIYMTHVLHGVHIAYDESEIKRNEANGWVVYGDLPPGKKVEPVEYGSGFQDSPVVKRGRPRKAA